MKIVTDCNICVKQDVCKYTNDLIEFIIGVEEETPDYIVLNEDAIECIYYTKRDNSEIWDTTEGNPDNASLLF